MNVFGCWLVGFAIGIEIWKKIPKPRLIIPIPFLLGAAGVYLATNGEGLNLPKLTPAAVAEKQPYSRNLGHLVVTHELLKRLKRMEAERDREGAKTAIAAITTPATWTFVGVGMTSSPPIFVTASGRVTQPTPKGTRKGPFCQITCSVHHKDTYQAEVEQQLCRDNKIDPDAAWVPGWGRYDDSHEIMNDWPGPQNPGGGFDGYKLAWK